MQNITTYYSDIYPTPVPTLLSSYNYTTTLNTLPSYSNYIYTSNYYDYIEYGFLYRIPGAIYSGIIDYIPTIEDKIIPKSSYDIITYEEINNDDILIDFKRDDKTEYEYGAYYKESNLQSLLESLKNPFTMNKLDIESLVKFKALVL